MGFQPGSVASGRFEIVRQIGAGGLAEVFLARDRVTGAEVALKALHTHLLFDEGLKERFRRELAVTRQLDHPGIVRVYDLHEDEGRPFFAMELLKGESLAERLRTGPIEPDEARQLAVDICAALQAAHKAGVVHRDLKPQNIFLAETGGARPQVKLLDFGLARAAGWARLTAQSTVMGTPGYAAPEVIAGGGSDPRSDLYSLAATLFEMLTGRRAFPSADPYQALRQQKGAAPSARAFNGAVGVATDAIVRRALDPDPEQRFADAGQMAAALASGAAPAQPVRVPPAMTAGKYRLVVHKNQDRPDKESRRELGRLLWILGLDETAWRHKRWIDRIGLFGSAPLISGCSRETGQSIAALCQEQGVPATVEEDQQKEKASPFTRFVVGTSGVAVVMQLAGALVDSGGRHNLSAPLIAGVLVASAALAGCWGWLVHGAKAPVLSLPAGDPAVRRLLDGIVRRAGRLKERQKDAPEAVQYLRDDLVRAATELVVQAEALADRAAAIPDDLAPLTPAPMQSHEALIPTEAPTLITSRRPEERDLLVGRLLEIAAALDEALAASALSQEAASEALARLREEKSFAGRAIPEIEATLRGEPVAAPLLEAPAAPASTPHGPAAREREKVR